MTTDTSEKGLERLICEALTGAPCDAPQRGAHDLPSGRLAMALAGCAATRRTTTESTA